MNPYVLGSLIDSFVREKKMSGYSFRVQERWMRQFKAFCNEYSDDSERETLELMGNFYTSNPGESIATRQKRQCLMRQFAVYLNKHGIMTPLPEPPDKYFSYPKKVPYIFTKQELAAIFRQILVEKMSLTKQQVDELLEHFIVSLPAYFKGKLAKLQWET